jgi:nitrite reductase/ring-hydroxylating ferredoxin subunit
MSTDRVTRRGWLQATALLAGAPCACLAQASHDCCTVPEAPADGVRIQPGLITIDLDRTPALNRRGAAVKVVDSGRKLQVLIARCGKEQFVALDQKCTHGGGALTYVHKHKHLYCTCWGHAKFALDGSVLRWPNRQTPRPLRAYTVERKGRQLDIRVPGLA